MMQMHDIVLIVMAITLIGFAMNLLYTMRAFKVLILWSILLSVTEMAVAQMHYEIKWYVLSILPFYLFALIYMMVKLRIRINETLKRIDKREKEEKREARKEKIRAGAEEMAQLYRTDPELKELNEFVGDYHETLFSDEKESL